MILRDDPRNTGVAKLLLRPDRQRPFGMFHVAIQTEAFQARGEDRVEVIAHSMGIVIVVADGAGGTSGGADAADTVLLRARSHVTSASDNLTTDQIRKPLLGSGESQPVAFEQAWQRGTLLVATDGLIKYAPPARICEVARGPDLHATARHLIDLVRLRSGALQDDVGVALCRPATR